MPEELKQVVEKFCAEYGYTTSELTDTKIGALILYAIMELRKDLRGALAEQ